MLVLCLFGCVYTCVAILVGNDRYELLHSVDVGIAVNSASLHPSKHRFAAGGQDFWVRVHDSNAGEIGEKQRERGGEFVSC